LGHSQFDDVDLAVDNGAVFDKVLPEARRTEVNDADVKADGEWKLQLDKTVGFLHPVASSS